MSLLYDADKVINFLLEHKYIIYNDWKDNNKKRYNIYFERSNGLEGLTSFEITVDENGKHLIREQNISLSLMRLNLSSSDMEEVNKFII